MACCRSAHQKEKLNWNVRLTLLFSFVLSTSTSLLSQTPLAAFVLLLRHDDHLSVGVATGIQGVVNLCFALPAGVLADRIGRSALLRAAAVVALVACAYMAVCLLYLKGRVSDDVLYYALCGASALWGVFMGLHSSPLAALFADSIESGARSKLYVWRSSLRTAGNAVGPLVSIVVFSILGDEWRVDELTYVLLGGVGAMVLPALALFAFSDRRALGAASEGLFASAAALSTAPSAALLGADATAAQVAAARSQRRACCCLTTAHIAPLVAIGDLLSMLGSGMTIKFFALFFWQGLGLEPVAVNAVYVAGPLGIAVSALLAQKLSLCIGRIQTCLLCRGIGIGLLVAIAYVQSAAIVLPLYLLRTWLMNCTAGLTKSVLNDYVAKANRGKWNSLESINLFGWSGSAALGGWLIDVIGYRHTFLITAALQLCAAVCIAPLAFLVHAESGARGFRRPADMLPATAASTNAEPLLPGPGAAFLSPPPNPTGFTPIEPALPSPYGRMPTPLTTASGSEGLPAPLRTPAAVSASR